MIKVYENLLNDDDEKKQDKDYKFHHVDQN